MTLRRVLSLGVLLLFAGILNSSLVAGTPSGAAFKKLQSLAGQAVVIPLHCA